jgi:hypothetical protein
MSDTSQGAAQEGSRHLGGVQAASPAAEGGGIGYAIRVFKRRYCFFPGAVLLEAPPQGLIASQEAVVRVRERKGCKKGERFPATGAAATADLDPVVIPIVRLLAAASMANDRVPFTNGTSPHDYIGALFGPVGFELARLGGKWDKENRNASGLCLGIDPPRSKPEAEPPPPEEKSNWKRITLLGYRFQRRNSNDGRLIAERTH